MFHESAFLKKCKILEMLIRDQLLFQAFGNRSFSFRFFKKRPQNLNFLGAKLAFAKIAKMQNFGDSWSLLRLF